MSYTSDCPKCGAPRGVIGWMCDCWYDTGNKNNSAIKIDPNCEHKFTFELADVELLLKIIN